MVPPEAGERHTNGLAFAFIIAQPKKRGKHVRGIGGGKMRAESRNAAE